MKIAATISDAVGPTTKLRAAYKVGDGFALANNEEYKGLNALALGVI